MRELEDRVHRQEDLNRIQDDNLDLQDAEVGELPVLYLDGEHLSVPANSFALTVAVRRSVARRDG